MVCAICLLPVQSRCSLMLASIFQLCMDEWKVYWSCHREKGRGRKGGNACGHREERTFLQRGYGAAEIRKRDKFSLRGLVFL